MRRKRHWNKGSASKGLPEGRQRLVRFFLVYTALFSVTFALAFSPFFLEGKSFIWYNDGHFQHYPALVYIGRYLRQTILGLLRGTGGPVLFDLNLAMGGDVIATLNYYGFGNPLYLLSAFVPTHYTERLFNVLLILRFYLAGLSFCALCVYHKKPLSHAAIGALIYIFSGYALHSGFTHPYFIEPMIQLPLLLIGIDMIIRRKDPLLFIFSVFYSALCGFYFLYMMTLMLGFYALIRFFSCYTKNRVKEFACLAGRGIGAYCLGIGLSAPLFLPGIIGFLSSGRTGGGNTAQNYFSYGWTYYRDNFLKLVAPPGTWFSLALASIVLYAIVLLLAERKKHGTLKGLLAVCVTLYVLPFGGHMMNGFSYPVQRWTFGAALLLSFIAVEMLPTLLCLNWKQQCICLLVLFLYATFVFADVKVRNIYHVVGVAMLGATLVVLLVAAAQRDFQGSARHTAAFVLCAVLVAGNVSVNAIFKMADDQGGQIRQHRDHGEETTMLESAMERDAEPYLAEGSGRFDSSQFTRNVGAIWRVPTMSTYWSILNQNVEILGAKVENCERRFSSISITSMNGRTGIDALFSTKYVIEAKDRAQYVPYGYIPLEETQQGNLIYENQYALPWGYTYDSYITQDELNGKNGLQVETAMLQHIVLDDSTDFVAAGVVEDRIQKVPYRLVESQDVSWNNGTLTVNKSNANLTLEFQMPSGVEGYLRLEKFKTNSSRASAEALCVTCHGVKRDAYVTQESYVWHDGRENYLVNLGYSEEMRETCTITFPNRGTYRLDDIQLFALPMDEYPAQIEALRVERLENIVFEPNRITGTVELSRNKILCLSVPCSNGWSAKVDGQSVDILRGNYAFMALPLTAGHHDIEFTYCTPGLKIGIVASLLSVSIVIYLVYQERKKRQVL